ncbi:cytochrome c-type biogenesis protein CcmH [Mesobacillus zeae]|uniref:Cytochrome c-type biogenesis protein n=1 Tax=Mesobacillus zeae TaxID=1917180 RepID=A0A398BGW0_9BACI|nr:cytochrome c-type biogenesis protein CcmH [Mesobacillus zeae]RID86806.1 hypothetical protein D1970_06000 [Mesobacillus zeae]
MKFLSNIMIAVLVLFGASTTFAAEKEFDYSRPDFQEVVGMLSMEGHGTHDVSNCSVKKLYYDEIAEMMNKGMSKDEVLDYYVKNLGDQALQAPPKKGFNMTLWYTPFLILMLAGGVIYFSLKKWVSKKVPTPSPLVTVTESADAEILSSMIENERKKYL